MAYTSIRELRRYYDNGRAIVMRLYGGLGTVAPLILMAITPYIDIQGEVGIFLFLQNSVVPTRFLTLALIVTLNWGLSCYGFFTIILKLTKGVWSFSTRPGSCWERIRPTPNIIGPFGPIGGLRAISRTSGNKPFRPLLPLQISPGIHFWGTSPPGLISESPF